MQEVLKCGRIKFTLFDGVFSNPTTDLARKATEIYKDNDCDSIIAYGGGSPMDLAKAVGEELQDLANLLEKMAGILKVGRRLPLLIAIPTTAGTGSETTLASVMIDSKTRHKLHNQ